MSVRFLNLEQYMTALTGMTEKLSIQKARDADGRETPYVCILSADGNDTSLAFHGVPGT